MIQCQWRPSPTVRSTKFALILTASVFWVYFMSLKFFQVTENIISRPLMFGDSRLLDRQIRRKKLACEIPILNPLDPQVKKYVLHPNPVDCEQKYPQIFKSDLNRTLIRVTDPSRHGYSKCCFQAFLKDTNGDHSATYTETCVPITEENTVINPPIQFIRIKCFNGRDTVPVDFFGFIPLKTPKLLTNSKEKPPVGQFDYDNETDRSEAPRKVNVVILSFDTVSHMNFQRVMPLSYAYLTKTLKAVGMSGYTKVGENTWPNFVAAFTGLELREFSKIPDDCPFIWKDFSRQEYLTAFGEDASGMVNLRPDGKEAILDYYHNTLTFAADGAIGHQTLQKSNLCYGPRFSFEVLLDFMKKMAFNLSKVRPYLQIIWEQAFTHDDLNRGMLLDHSLLDTLTWFHKGGYLEDTVLILMSDHGIISSPIVEETLQGKLETRMPLLYFVFPTWFTDQYPVAMKNIKENGRMLTSPFDLHETLFDLAVLQKISNKKIYDRHLDLIRSDNRPRGISLFLPIPEDRSCAQAGIPEMWCVCRTRKHVDVQNNELVKEAAKNAVEFMNRMFVPFPQCEKLTLKSVNDAQVFQTEYSNVKDMSESIKSSNDERLKNQTITYSISFTTSPSDATFEMTTTRETNGTWTTLSEISRTNLYGNQSSCVDDLEMKKLCFCK